jgi:hypothetical protein
MTMPKNKRYFTIAVLGLLGVLIIPLSVTATIAEQRVGHIVTGAISLAYFAILMRISRRLGPKGNQRCVHGPVEAMLEKLRSDGVDDWRCGAMHFAQPCDNKPDVALCFLEGFTNTQAVVLAVCNQHHETAKTLGTTKALNVQRLQSPISEFQWTDLDQILANIHTQSQPPLCTHAEIVFRIANTQDHNQTARQDPVR